jgi:hypothetical protein
VKSTVGLPYCFLVGNVVETLQRSLFYVFYKL